MSLSMISTSKETRSDMVSWWQMAARRSCGLKAGPLRSGGACGQSVSQLACQ
jgi:hypothetical protein